MATPAPLRDRKSTGQLDLTKDSTPDVGSPPVKPAALVLRASLFASVLEESAPSTPEPPSFAGVQAAATPAADGAASAAADSNKLSADAWRTLLVSPLGTLLTGVRNKYPWVQLAGHKGSFVPGRGGTICKKGSKVEQNALETLMYDKHLKPLVPLYYKDYDAGDGERYLEMQDLLANFQNPSVMDIKMGVRTFLETEVNKLALRKDLLEKMVALAPDEPTPEEREHGITKLRYMTFRERLSSSKTLGFRVEGIKLAGRDAVTSFKRVQTADQVRDVIMSFLPPKDDWLHHVVAQKLSARLEDMYEAMIQSEFFKNHEIVGSSLLFVYDHTGMANIWMIDFGKTLLNAQPLQHDQPWELGNHEDGYLIGLNNLRQMFAEYH